MEAVKGLRLPSCYVEVTDNEIEYLDGSLSFWAKVGIIAACVGICALIAGAIATGTLAVIATVLKMTFAVFVKKFGVLAVAKIILGAVGVGAAAGITIAGLLIS